jgi:hypothetical protein
VIWPLRWGSWGRRKCRNPRRGPSTHPWFPEGLIRRWRQPCWLSGSSIRFWQYFRLASFCKVYKIYVIRLFPNFNKCLSLL